jgi:hypothetical protein
MLLGLLITNVLKVPAYWVLAVRSMQSLTPVQTPLHQASHTRRTQCMHDC